VAEATAKRLVHCGFRRTGKEIGQVYQCWWRICREINAFPDSNITFISVYDLFNDSSSYFHLL
jgi:hypothetical protein